MKIENKVIVPMLTTIQAIWIPKFKPTEKEREKTVSTAAFLDKGGKLEGPTIIFGAKANCQYSPVEIVERHRVAVSEDSWEHGERITRNRDVDCGMGQVHQLSIP